MICKICNKEIVLAAASARAEGRDIYCCKNPGCLEDFDDYIENVPREAWQNELPTLRKKS